MKYLAILILLIPVLVISQPPVHQIGEGGASGVFLPGLTVNSANDLENAQVKSGGIINTLGYTTPGDGGGGTYLVEGPGYTGPVDSIHTRPMANGNFARLMSMPFTFKQYGFIDDVVEGVTVSISNDTVTCATCSFSSEDQGDKILIERSYDVSPKFLASDRYDQSYPNFSAVPASYLGDTIVQVVNSEDFGDIDTLTGLHYFNHHVQFGWVPMLHLVGGTYDILEVISPTQIVINYTAPNPLPNLIAHYGYNNQDNWNKILQFIADSGEHAHINQGDFMIHYPMDTNEGSFYFNDGLATNGKRTFKITGEGRNSTLHFWYHTDTLAVQTDPTQPDNNFYSGFFTYRDPRATNNYDEIHFDLQSFDFKGIPYTGFRNVDAANKGAFAFTTGKGTIRMHNVRGSGGDGLAYHGGNWITNYQEIEYDGMHSAEVGFQNFGAMEFTLRDFLLKNIGPFPVYTVYSSNGRGRPTYTNPNQKKVTITDGEYRDCPGVNHQLFSGGGLDAPDTLGVDQTYDNLKFVWTKQEIGSTSIGLYLGRVGEKVDVNNCTFEVYGLAPENTGGLAILLNGEASITGCNFRNLTSISVGDNVGTNNVRHPADSTAVVFIDNCTFTRSNINVANLNVPSPNFELRFTNFDIEVDSTPNIGQFIRMVDDEGGFTDRRTTAIFDGGQIEGFLNRSPSVGLPNETPLIFIENQETLTELKFKNTYFNTRTFPNSTGHQFLIKQMRNGARISFENCYANPGDTIYIDVDPGGTIPMITGENNKFDNIEFNGTEFPHELKLRNDVCDTLTNAATLTIPGISCNEWYVSGTGTVNDIDFGIGGSANTAVEGDLFLYFIDGGTLGTTGNINLGSPRVLVANDRIRLRPDPVTKTLNLIEVNQP